MSCQCAQMRIHQAWSRTQQTEGTYPEYDVETEDEILDAAAHFMSLEMLSGHHLDGFFFSQTPPVFGRNHIYSPLMFDSLVVETPFFIF